MSSEDLDGQAIVSLIAGVAAMMFVLFGPPGIQFVGLLGGVIAVKKGVEVLRASSSNPKLAVTGTVTGTIAVAGWLLVMAWRTAAAVWGWIF